MSEQSLNKNKKKCVTLESLPLDIIYVILNYCDTKSLCSLSVCSKKLHQIISDDYVWFDRSCDAIATNQSSKCFRLRSARLLSAKEKCRISLNWKKAVYNEYYLVNHKSRYLPWLCLEKQHLWFSKGEIINKFKRIRKNGRISYNPELEMRLKNEDVCRFVINRDLVITGGRKGSIALWNKFNGNYVCHQKLAHFNEVNCVDSYNNQLILSGSKDQTVKIWSTHQNQYNLHKKILKCEYTLPIGDRIWSVAINDANNHFIVGSSGVNQSRPLRLYDLHNAQHLYDLGNNYRNTSGVLHAIWESETAIISCGYDTCVRVWDIRQNPNNCVLKLEDPHDSAVYCIDSDHCNTILSGTSRYGVTRVWDKRCMKTCVQMYYVGKNNSPVYCLSFDACYAYIALDYSINLLSFETVNVK